MKLPPFEYVCPDSLGEAITLLSLRQGRAKAIAGGQSLMPVLAFRLASPDLLVDLRKVPGLGEINIDSNGVRLGALVRWCDILGDARLRTAHPLLQSAIAHVAHYQIRNRGTVGGSLAHADPAAEMPGIAVTCDARVEIAGPKGMRETAASDFFTGPLSTVLEYDELILGIRIPHWKSGRRWAFNEFAIRRGDFSLAGVAVFYDLDSSGRAANTHIGVIGACERPRRLPHAEAALDGQVVASASIAVAAHAATASVDPPDDLHASAEYRRALVGTLLQRALQHTLLA